MFFFPLQSPSIFINPNWSFILFIFVSFFRITLHYYFATLIKTYAMTTTKTSNENFNIDDFDSILAALSAEELENINDVVDPEVNIYSFSIVC